MMNNKILLGTAIAFSSLNVNSEGVLLFESEYRLSTTVVSSTCLVGVLTSSSSTKNNVIDFGVYNKDNPAGFSSSQTFQVIVYEDNIDNPGCSAFLAGKDMVSLKFGDISGKQLDEYGVVTFGAGNGVRISVSATDAEASSSDTITSTHNELFYKPEFASNGKFGFVASVTNIEKASVGAYQGSLSLIISYR
ncbi:TPA: hypothetical protein RG830_004149 [Vibrio vulnificus]|nr:hypothetical protein [Vibrio vulnificus]